MNSKFITKEIKNYLYKTWDVDLVGICPASALDAEPEGYRPMDILPCAKSVIVYGKRLLDGGVQAAFRKLEDGSDAAESIYSTYGFELLPNWNMLFITFYMADYLENTFGASTQPVCNGPDQNGLPKNTALPMFAGPYQGGLPFNVRHAAVAAGIAQPAWSNFVVTKEFGPRVQFGCIITSLDLEYDEPDNGPRLCNPDECHVCSEMCPMEALPARGAAKPDVWTIAGKEYEVSKHNVNACTVAALGLREEYQGRRRFGNLIGESKNPTEEEVSAAFKALPISPFDLDHYPKTYCNKCQLYCPLGNRKEHFTDRGLSDR